MQNYGNLFTSERQILEVCVLWKFECLFCFSFFRVQHHIKETFADVEKILVVEKPKNTK